MNSPDEPLYFDHGATSWPKPAAVFQETERFYRGVVANAGRSGHRASFDAARRAFDVRRALARLLGVSDPRNLIFTRGATEGLNLVLKGFLREGDLVLVSPMEHNSVMRPLSWLARDRKLKILTLPADEFGRVDPERAARQFAEANPRLLVVMAASNVTGAVNDLGAVKRAFPRTPLLVDAAQTAGVLPIDVEGSAIDFLVCSAHKGLLGPTGVGAVYLSPQFDVEPLVHGGTGSRSEDLEQPLHRPDRYESGTLNLHGLAGCAGALSHLEKHGLSGDHKRALTTSLLRGISSLAGVKTYCPDDGTALLLSCTVEGMTPDDLAFVLEQDYGILGRPGLHCAPAAHSYLGTHPAGTLRLSPGYGNTMAQVETVIAAIAEVLERSRG